MKKIISLTVVAFLFILVGCSGATETGENKVVSLTSKQSLAFSTYLASGFLTGASNDTNQNMSVDTYHITGIQYLSNTTEETVNDPTLEIDTELDEVNLYFNKLKVFMDKGLDSAINIEETVSTRDGYDYQVTYTIDDESYTIYYSYVDEFTVDTEESNDVATMNATTEEDTDKDDDEIENENEDQEEADVEEDEENEEEFKLQGLMIINDVEYKLVGANETEGNESKMWFETIDETNTGDYVNVEMKEEEGEQKFEIETVIDGVEKTSEIKFEQEESETKVELELYHDGQESSYEFKKETEDGETVYKFEYAIGETEGEVKIYEEIDEQGNVSYRYKIDEEGKGEGIERRRNDVDDEDDDEDEEDETEEDENVA
ncbi:hypothetical protein [Haloplasma contractile]|uniref:Membrane lipoprotein n=1 Tax=Haloplasma contractile SSD-17B TaxID=1033810 RepID=U2FIW6_9MOLU|nr:hypothetical protein [Haloplasma contractile]ERJ11204.1 membrane lipoprotein [Haloplasma contractile SSD-17B]